MLDVLFIIPNSAKKIYQGLSTNNYTAIETPTWALMLASSMRNYNYSCEILDCDAEQLTEEQSVERIKDSNCRLALFVLYGQQPNQGTFLMIGATSVAEKTKNLYPEINIGFVGSHISALPKEVLAYKFVDFVFINEGVYALRDLLKTDLKKNLNKVNGIGFKDEEGNLIINKSNLLISNENMSRDLPGYAWDLLPKKKNPLDMYRAHYWHSFFSEKDRTPFAAVYSSLGCKFGCNFCMINILNRTNINQDAKASDFKIMRHWDPIHFVNNLELLANMGVRTIRLSDEMFFLNKKYYTPILEEIIRRKLNLNMWAYSRVDTVREDQLELFKKAGINWLALGIEAGSQTVRTDIEKGRFKETNIRNIVKMINSYDINILGNYIFGLPEDNIDTMNETLDLAMELNTEHANFYPCQALPGSPLYFEAKKKGWEVPTKFEEYAFFSYECKPLPTNYCTPEEVLQFRDNAWNKYFTNPSFINKIKTKFGVENAQNIENLTKVKLKRKILGH
ncbi:B12-binding domain-containing radical SAM protein [Candidatus Pelagibacter sp.]|nr:B12-binding domain-containing radical SAM protein [Candidatus Pelagibacter sp.]